MQRAKHIYFYSYLLVNELPARLSQRILIVVGRTVFLSLRLSASGHIADLLVNTLPMIGNMVDIGNSAIAVENEPISIGLVALAALWNDIAR